jgi:amino acid adenylation domain-containing protein
MFSQRSKDEVKYALKYFKSQEENIEILTWQKSTRASTSVPSFASGLNRNGYRMMNDCLHYQFEQCAECFPDAYAVLAPARHLTYDELNRKANQVAHALRELGVGANDLVAVCLDHDHHLMVALLGVLKAGAAYVPLDPAEPGQRIDTFVKEVGCSLLLTSQRHAGRCVAAPRVLCLDADWPYFARCAQTNPRHINSSQDLIYCIFTSGSTGAPKGALNHHGGFANLCRWYAGQEAGGGPAARTLVLSSIGFDLTQKNLFEPLASGGLLILCDHRAAGSIDTAVRTGHPTRVNCAPSAFAAIRNVVLSPALRTVVFGGERLPAALVAELMGHGLTVLNSYGPTECADVSMVHVCGPDDHVSVPLGKPISNVEIHLVDAEMRRLTGTETGELVIGGAGVGYGYVARRDLTARSFIPNPWGGTGLVYRTGDLVRACDDGNLHYVGRADQQVKIAGHRIEPSEVEAALLRCAEVEGCAVVAAGKGGLGTRLAAFVVLRDPLPPTPEASLRAALGRTLAPYMIPSVWRFVRTLPLTASGKVDRLALERALSDETARTAPAAMAANTLEACLVGIWQASLGHPVVGAEDDFFALGGDSLAALCISVAIHNQLHCQILLEHIYELRTVRKLAVMIAQAQAQAVPVPAPPVLPPAPSIAHSYLPGLAQETAAGKTATTWTYIKNYPIVLKLEGNTNISLLLQAVRATVSRHESLRTSFKRDNAGAIRAFVSAESPCAIEFLTVQGSPRERCDQMMAAIQHHVFDTSTAPLFRCVLAHVGPGTMLCGLVMHHLIADAWSTSLLTSSIGSEYARLLAGDDRSLPPAPPYSRFALAERRDDEAGKFLAHEAFWRSRLGNLPARMPTPLAEAVRPPVFDYRAEAVGFRLDAARLAAMRSLCVRCGASPYVVLLTCLAMLIHRFTGETDLYIKSPVSNRSAEHAADVIGPFGSFMVIRATVPNGTAPLQLLQQIRAEVLLAQRHAAVPSTVIERCFSPNRDNALPSRFPIIYNHHNYPPHPAQWGDLRLSRLQEQSRAIKADLVLHSWLEDDELHCSLNYYTSVISKANAARLCSALDETVSALLAQA